MAASSGVLGCCKRVQTDSDDSSKQPTTISVRAVFVTVCLLEIIVCAALCSYLGYANAVSVTDRLAADTLDLQFQLFRTSVDGIFSPLLTATDSLQADFVPLLPVILGTNTVRDTPVFWNAVSRRFRRRLVLGQRLRESYSCVIGSASMGFIPEADRQTFIITDATTNNLGRILILNLSSDAPTDWRDIKADVPLNATFQTLLDSGLVISDRIVPNTITTRSWYREVLSSGLATIWTSPFLTPSGSVFFGNGKVLTDTDPKLPVGLCVSQVALPEVRSTLNALPFALKSRYLLVRRNGNLLLSSDQDLQEVVRASPNALLYLQNSTRALQVPVVRDILPALLRWGFITATSGVVPSGECSVDFLAAARMTIDGGTTLVRASCITTPGMDAVLVTLSREADFDNGADRLLTFSVIVSVAVLVGSAALTLAVVHCVWRPVSDVIYFMRELDRNPIWKSPSGELSSGSATAVAGATDVRSRLVGLTELSRKWDLLMGTGPVNEPIPPSPVIAASSSHNGTASAVPLGAAAADSSSNTAALLPLTSSRTDFVDQPVMAASTLQLAPALAAPAAVRVAHPRCCCCADCRGRASRGRGTVVSRRPPVTEHKRPAGGSSEAELIALSTNASPLLPLDSADPTSTAGAGRESLPHRPFYQEDDPNDVVLDVGQGGAEHSVVTAPGSSSSGPKRWSSLPCELTEPAVMRRTFGSMLHSLCAFQQETERANQAKRHFIRYIFHEVRVPFNAVSLCAESLDEHVALVLQQSTADAVLRQTTVDLMQLLRDQCSVVGRILTDVLSLQKMEEGKFTLTMAPFNPELLVRNTVSSFKSSYDKKHLDVSLQLQSLNDLSTGDSAPSPARQSPQGRLLMGDYHRLRQVLSIFISNAIMFTKRNGYIRIGLTLQHSDSSDGPPPAVASADSIPDALPARPFRVRISVLDSGIGMSQQQQDKLFTPFTQFSSGITHEGRASGLGLAIAKRLVELHGGHIGCSSQLGVGSEFFAELDCAVVPRDVLQPAGLSHDVVVHTLAMGGVESISRNSNSNSSREPPDHGRQGVRLDDGELKSPVGSIAAAAAVDLDAPKHGTASMLDDTSMLRQPSLSEPRPVVDQGVLSHSTPSFKAEMVPDLARTAAPGLNEITPRQSVRMPEVKIVGPVAVPLSNPAATRPSPALGRCDVRVLIAEDHVPTGRLMRLMLTKLGCESTVVENGSLAVQAFESWSAAAVDGGGVQDDDAKQQSAYPFDIVLMDGHMPVMDGYMATERLRSLGISVPIIAVTGNALQEDQQRFLDVGANQVLIKPVSRDLLGAALERFTTWRKPS